MNVTGWKIVKAILFIWAAIEVGNTLILAGVTGVSYSNGGETTPFFVVLTALIGLFAYLLYTGAQYSGDKIRKLQGSGA
jgi:hypothetical protein